MAVSLRRLSLAALVLIAMLIPILGTGRRPEPSASERRLARMYLLRQRLNVAAVRWGALALRDSGAIPASRQAAPGRPSVLLRGFGAGATAPAAVKVVDDLWTWLGPVDSTLRVAVLIYNAEKYSNGPQQWWNYSGASISKERGVATCVALVPGGRRKDGAIGVGEERLQTALAPCVLLAGFGPPGPALARWLGSTRYAAAGSVAWLNRSRSFIDGGRGSPPPWMGYYYWFGEERLPSQGLLSTSETAREIAQMLTPPYELGAYGLRCTGGEPSSCRKAVLDTTTIASATHGLPPDLTYSFSLLDRPLNWTLGTPRPPGEWWLSDLIRDQGRERFAKFWKSTAQFEQAFQEAFGEDLGAWTHRWSERQWENSWFEKYRHTPLILGATLQPSWSLLALGWAGVALVLTAWVARRRQVT